MAAGTGAVGKEGYRFTKLDSIACQITDAQLFDEAKFIGALREGVIQALSHEHATILGNLKDSDTTSFKLLYGLSDATGAVEISGTKGPERFYTLKASLDEQSKHAK